MYRRRIKKPRAPVFGKTIEEFGFKINANGRVVDVSPDGNRCVNVSPPPLETIILTKTG